MGKGGEPIIALCPVGCFVDAEEHRPIAISGWNLTPKMRRIVFVGDPRNQNSKMSACQRKRISHLSVAEVIFFEALTISIPIAMEVLDPCRGSQNSGVVAKFRRDDFK